MKNWYVPHTPLVNIIICIFYIKFTSIWYMILFNGVNLITVYGNQFKSILILVHEICNGWSLKISPRIIHNTSMEILIWFHIVYKICFYTLVSWTTWVIINRMCRFVSSKILCSTQNVFFFFNGCNFMWYVEWYYLFYF